MSEVKRDYEIGYGKPPRGRPFQKGQSGSPSGPRRKNLSALLVAATSWHFELIAGKLADVREDWIPWGIYDAAEVDGATGLRRFVHVTFPLLANLYSFARCSRHSGRSATSRPSILSRVEGRQVPRKCWRRSASTTPSTRQSRRSALPR